MLIHTYGRSLWKIYENRPRPLISLGLLVSTIIISKKQNVTVEIKYIHFKRV